MDVLNKFVSSVSNTVSQLSSVLPGNPVSKDFEIGEHIASAGPGHHSLSVLIHYTHCPLSSNKVHQNHFVFFLHHRLMLEDLQRS